MGNFDTVRAITDNLISLLHKNGIQAQRSSFADLKNMRSGSGPAGALVYRGESFEDRFNERPLYAEAEFALKVVLPGKDAAWLMREQQRTAHRIRGALTVDALNTGDLAASKLVSRVSVSRMDIENQVNSCVLGVDFSVRYRES